MKILVVGGVGFIGSNLCLSLIKDGHYVKVIDDASTGRNYREISKVVDKFDKYDIVSSQIAGWQFEDMDVIYNLVGKTSHVNSMKKPLEDLRANVIAPFTVLELARLNCPNAKVIFTGTRGQYGKIQYLPVDENHSLISVDVNGISKNAAEEYHFLYSRQYGMDTVSLRLTNIFGPRHQMETPDGVLNWFIKQALYKEKISIYGGGRDILYVDDCVNALKAAISLDKKYSGQAFNIGSGVKTNLKDYIETLAKIIPIDYEIIEKENILEIGDYVADISKFSNATGWMPSMEPLEDQIKKTIEFYNSNYHWVKDFLTKKLNLEINH